MRPLVLLLPDPPLDPTGAEARARLRRELLRPEYHDQFFLQRIVNWLSRQLDSGLGRASQAPQLSTLMAMVLFVGLALALGWLVSRARRTARDRGAKAPVLTDEVVTADELRARAEAALAAGRCEEALIEAFRALTVRQVERGRLDDAPGATAHEVADSLALVHPDRADRVRAGALLFDEVRYGDRPATPGQAGSVLALDDDLMARR